MSSLLERLEAGVASQLFVHCATPAGPSADSGESVRGVERHAERALVLARSQDVVCVAGEVGAFVGWAYPFPRAKAHTRAGPSAIAGLALCGIA